LHLAVIVNDPLICSILILLGADISARHTSFRKTMLHEAACNDSAECLQLLLELMARYNPCQDTPESKMHVESHQQPTSSTELLEQMINVVMTADKESNMMNPNDKEWTVCRFKAAQKLLAGVSIPPDTNIVLSRMAATTRSRSLRRSFASRLAQKSQGVQKQDNLQPKLPANYTTICDGQGNTPLHWACFKSSPRCAALLLQHPHNANPNSSALHSGWTPLHDAAYSDSADCINLCMKRGANADARANSGATPLCFAAQEDCPDAVEELLKWGAQSSVMCCQGTPPSSSSIAFNSDAPMTPIPAHLSRFSGYTPMHYCAHYNAARAAKILIKCGASIECEDLSGRKPIHVAAGRASPDVLKALLCAGARLDNETSPSFAHGRSPGAFVADRSSVGLPPHLELPSAATVGATGYVRSRNVQRFLSFSPRSSVARGTSMGARGQGEARVLESSNRTDARRHAQSRALRFSARMSALHQTSIASRIRSSSYPPAAVYGADVTSPQRSSLDQTATSPVSSPVLRSIIPAKPIVSSKPWNCLSQNSIDMCHDLLDKACQHWSPSSHVIFSPTDRRAVLELLRVGKRYEQMGTGVFADLWPMVLSFCPRGWFDSEENEFIEESTEKEEENSMQFKMDIDEEDPVICCKFAGKVFSQLSMIVSVYVF